MVFTAVDFETANQSRNSACALGITVVNGDRILEEKSWLIRPPKMVFHPINVRIHGITARDVRSSPQFHELWPEIKDYLIGKTVAAHNASFDMSVLRHVLDTYNLPYPTLRYLCSMNAAKKTWPDLSSYSLNNLAEFLHIDFTHHDACEDARACAEVLLRACDTYGASSLDELILETEIVPGRLSKKGYTPCRLRA